jgi:hypothetical protein
VGQHEIVQISRDAGASRHPDKVSIIEKQLKEVIVG